MIEVYVKGNADFARNGDITLEPQECTLFAEVNGEIKIELTHKYDDIGRWKYLQEENVIAAPTPWSKKQLFRIYKKEKETRKMKVYARHIWYDLRHFPILDRRPTDKNGGDALNVILEGTGYTGHSNILTINTAYYVRKNPVSAIAGDDENSFLNRWGGEILPDNFDIYVYDRIGEDRGVRAEFGHNLKEIKETVSTDDVVTRIIPIGAEGLMLEGDEPWVDSPNINAYPVVKTKFIEHSDIKVKTNEADEDGYETEEEARQALVAAAELEFENGIDEPTVNYVVNMELLENTVEYKRYNMLEKVLLGDDIQCKHKGIDIKIKARCISIEWDCIRRKNKKLELGNYISTYFDEQYKVNKQVSKVENMYTKEQVNEMLEKNLQSIIEKDYVSNDDMKTALADYITQKVFDNTLAGYVTQKVLDNTLAGYITQKILDDALVSYVKESVLNETIKQESNALKGEIDTERKRIDELEKAIEELENGGN